MTPLPRTLLSSLASRVPLPTTSVPRRTPALALSSLRSKRTLVTSRPSFRSSPRHRHAASTQVPRTSVDQIRWKSGEAEKGGFRQWGFEDITSSLPADVPTPGSRPEPKLILVDVREPAELASTGIIPSAVAVPLGSQPDALFLSPDEFETRFGYPKPGVGEQGETDMVFYCKAGVRAKTAAQLAVQAGYDPARVGVYEGSWLDWSGKGGKVQKWEEE